MNNNRYSLRDKKIEHLILQLFNFVEEYQPELLTFPLDVKRVILLIPQYKIWTYKYHSDLFNLTPLQTEIFCRSKTGCTACNKDNQYIILYNDKMPLGRQRFTLAHELGHCLLSHFNIYDNVLIAENGVNNNIDTIVEAEADLFAAALLCPFAICKKLNIHSPVDIKHIFGLSDEASYIQWGKYLNWLNLHYKTAYDSEIIKYFDSFTTSCELPRG